MRRKIADEREARALLAKAARAGGDVRAVTLAHGIDGRSLNAWRNNLARVERKGAGPGIEGRARGGLVELLPPEGARGRMAPVRYVLRVMGAELEFGDDVRADTLLRVLEVLRSC